MIAGSYDVALKRPLRVSTLYLLRGSIPGRQLIESVVELDAVGRIQSMTCASLDDRDVHYHDDSDSDDDCVRSIPVFR